MRFSDACIEILRLEKKWRYITRPLMGTIVIAAIALSLLQPRLYEACAKIEVGQIVRVGQVSAITHPKDIFRDHNFSFVVDQPWALERPEKIAARVLEEHYRETKIISGYSKPYIADATILRPDDRKIEVCARAPGADAAVMFVSDIVDRIESEHRQVYENFVGAVRKIIEAGRSSMSQDANDARRVRRGLTLMASREKLLRYRQMLDPSVSFPTRISKESAVEASLVRPKPGVYVSTGVLLGLLAGILMSLILEYAIRTVSAYRGRRADLDRGK